MSDVFISYSRKDSEFVSILHEALEKSNRETWVDWEGIVKGTEWWKEIEEGIEGADTFVFVISPDSVASKVCQDEINHAIKYNKQILPIVYRDAYELLEKENSAHQAISSHNWLFFRDTDNFDQSFKELIDALNLDIAHVKGHTHVLVRALKWDNEARKEGFLLRSEELGDGEKLLKAAEDKDPKPTALQITYLKTSREMEDAKHQAVLILEKAKEKPEAKIEKANQNVTEAKTQQKQIVRRGLIFLGITIVCTGAAIACAELKTIEAQNNLENTNIQVGATEVNEKNRLEGHQSAVYSVSYAPDGKTLASASRDRTVKLWDVGTGKVLRTLEGHQSEINSVSYAPDGKTLASASGDGTVKLWDVGTIKVLLTLKVNELGVNSVSYAPDGKTLASASGDGTIKLWDVGTGKLLRTLEGYQDSV
jgi:hypothetical protein